MANGRASSSAEGLDHLNKLDLDKPVPFGAWDRTANSTWIAALEVVGPDDAPVWSGSDPRPAAAIPAKGFAMRTKRSLDHVQGEPKAFLAALQDEFPELRNFLPDDFDGFALLGNEQNWVALNLFPHKGERHVFRYRTLVAPPSGGRLPTEYAALAGKSVAIVGVGSVGSKIAISLARAGVRNFTLVDDDVLFAANLVRNQLDAAGLGLHKVDALTTRIEEIGAGAKIHCRRVGLGQQESAGTTESVMRDLANVDLLIDATADPRAFNLIGAVARREKKPLVWCQVFAGGIGGIVVRLKPDIDPIPSIARDQVRTWCDSQGIAWGQGNDVDYGVRTEDGVALVADDAEVSVIAAHATRMALDALLRENSIFPSSAYAIGLSAKWIFTAPFDTWPITLEAGGLWGLQPQQASPQEVESFLAELFPRGDSA